MLPIRILLGILLLASPARQKAEEVAAAHGGRAAFYALRDVQYRLTNEEGESKERYLFEGEQSSGVPSDRYHRKRNYFLFALPFKLLDEGVQFGEAGNGWFDISFPEGVGDVTNNFRVFVSPETNRIEKVLFSDRERDLKSKFLMTCVNEEVAGIWLATRREIYRVGPDGAPQAKPLSIEVLKDIRFWNGFTAADFSSP